MEKRYNMRSPAVKRLMREAMELREPTPMYYAQPLEDNLFEWHFTIRGPEGTEFDGGFYHGRVILPSEYPMKPPSIIIMTPNGRFALHQKICLSASSYHPELWQPSWSIRTVLLAIIGFMPTEGVGAVGSLDCSTVERRRMAKRSLDWTCDVCGVPNRELLASGMEDSLQRETLEEAADIVSQMAFKSESEVQQQKKALSQQKQQQQQPQQQEKQESEVESGGVTTVGRSSVDTPTTEPPPMTSSQSDQSGDATDGGGVSTEPVSEVRRRQPQTNTAPSRVNSSSEPHRGSSSEPPGGFPLFLIVLLLVCIVILVARRLVIIYIDASS